MSRLNNLASTTVEITVTADTSLSAIWNKVAQQLTEENVQREQIVALRQQFFLGAQMFAVILKSGFERDDSDTVQKLLKEINENLMGDGG